MASVRKSKTSVFAKDFHSIGFFSGRRAFFWSRLKKHARPNARQNISGFVQGHGLKTSVLAKVQTHRFGQVVVSVRQFLQSEIRLFLVSLLRRKALVFLRKALA
ncbi:TPA: hypothetical protein L4958_006611 [Pseudomonas aeruginosa]|nr:hypothetical protein [Pseudomonas aeruginosa]HBO7040060.1 hypothetical protein [Pseudomonas aeruginosa]